MRAVLIMLALLVSGTGTAPATAADAGRAIYCAADDAYVRLALDGWLQQGHSRRIDRVQGLLALKQDPMPQEARALALTTKMLSGATRNETSLRLTLGATYPALTRTAQRYAIDLTLDVAGEPGAPRWQGHYRLVIASGPAGRTPLVPGAPISGPLFCNIE